MRLLRSARNDTKMGRDEKATDKGEVEMLKQVQHDRKKKGMVRRGLEYLSTFLVIVAMLLALAVLLGPRLGWQVNTVLSGSMTPAIDVGGAVISQKVDPRAVEVGDIITFYCPETGKVTTHRVTEIQTGTSLFFQTKGDANEDPDPYIVPAGNLLGRVSFDVPYIGYATQYARSPVVFLIMLTVPGLIIIITEMRDIWIELSEQEKRDKMKKAQKSGMMGSAGARG